ncbi:hypothetical protein NOJ28_13305 [Neorhizobium galegae]|uniref:hypothetical protein n=1 Tax=Neorhizobium galegae TaxID=399 RepID=UPI000621DFC3|nr:hypothetical protein [Neorhizobium galegae]MCQ1766516.1 hypothetical protein [Neorhizobium galegae]MCQ1845430.1 hypothetical protein [Neorhizobium galegae]CDZ36216.1 Hypothetical protein NGAL_HAMBI1146_17570 [Neorhizobium galegae bv. officinalis]
MNIHGHTRAEQRQAQDESPQKPVTGELWKLLGAAALILFGLIVAMEAFRDGNNNFIAPTPAQQTVIE